MNTKREHRLRILATDLQLAIDTLAEGDLGGVMSQLEGLVECAPADRTPDLLEACRAARELLRDLLNTESAEEAHDLIVNNRAVDTETDLIAALAKAKGE